ncbi:MAG TPA: FAD-dependent oxidoreductase, partial [Dehalococcoidales bacterium]|nr:FAD-dependent oxidoreductase [Dehalococcoidales bacterium]
DAVVLALGGSPVVPDIPGVDKPIVVSNQALHKSLKRYLRFLSPRALRYLTKFWMPLGKRVIIIGGSIQGCELAEFLVKRGRNVTLVDTGKISGEGMPEERSARLLAWFAKKGVHLISEVSLEQITDDGLIIIRKDGSTEMLKADNIILALPFKPDTGLQEELEGKFPEVYSIGDCKEPRLILDAINEGSHVANAL